MKVRFRYRDTWLLLATLALEPQINRREALIHRLALDSQHTGREKLRLRLNDLRHGAAARKQGGRNYCGIGSENLIVEEDRIALAPGTLQTDLEELESLADEAARCTSTPERLDRLKRGAALLTGSLLDGFTPPTPQDPWLDVLRFRTDRLAMEVWLKLAQALEAKGERRSAFDAARKAYSLSPENPEALELLLGLAEGTREQDEVLKLSRQLGVEGLLSRLEVLEQEGQSLTISEENALLEAVKVRLLQLSQKAVIGLKSIACFPQDFTSEQALAIADVSPDTLERLVKAFPLHKVNERFHLTPALRHALTSLLTEKEKQAFYARHAHHCEELFEKRLLIEQTDPEGFKQRIKLEVDHFMIAMNWFQDQPPSLQGVLFLHHCWARLGEMSPLREALFHATEYLETAVEVLREEEVCHPVELLGHILMGKRDFKKALHWFRLTYERFHTKDTNNWFFILLCAHHAAEDTVFDHYEKVFLSHFPIPHLSREGNGRFQEWIHIQIAENRNTRRNHVKALHHNEMAFSLRRSLGDGEDSAPALWGQYASILLGLERVEESERCWDRALKGYEAQGNLGGVAECYQAIGKLAARKGQAGMAVSLLRLAIETFQKLENHGAVAAAEGTLGDIYREQGELLKARDLYEKGLAYWRAQKHPRWTERFQQRLKTLEDQAGAAND